MEALKLLRRALFLRQILITSLCCALVLPGCGDSEPTTDNGTGSWEQRQERKKQRLAEIQARLEAIGTDTGAVSITVPDDGPPVVEGAAEAAEQQPPAEGLSEVHSLATFKTWFKKRTGQDWDGFVGSVRGARDAIDSAQVKPPSADALKQSIQGALATLGDDEEKLDAVNSLLGEVENFDQAAGLARDGVDALRRKTLPLIDDVDGFVDSVEALGADNWPADKVAELQKKNFVGLVKNLETLNREQLPELAEAASEAQNELEQAFESLKARYGDVANLLPDDVREKAEEYIERGGETVDEARKVLGALSRVAANSELVVAAFQAHPALGVAVALLLFALEYLGGGGDGEGEGTESTGEEVGAGGNEGNQAAEQPNPPTDDGNTAGLPAGQGLERPESSEEAMVGGSWSGSPWFVTWLQGDIFGLEITAEGSLSSQRVQLRREAGNTSLETIFERLRAARTGTIPQVKVLQIQLTDGAFPITVTFQGLNSDDSPLAVVWSATDAFEVQGTVH